MRLLAPRVLRTRRWLGVPGLVAARSPGGEYAVILAFREDRPGGRLLEAVAVGMEGWRPEGYICVSGWAGTARLEGLPELLRAVERIIPVDKAHVPASEAVFLIPRPEIIRPILHPAECSEALLSYIKGWLNYLERHSDLGLGEIRRRVEGLGLIIEYAYT